MPPKFTNDEIKADIAKLETGGFRCAVYYLKSELRRRQASEINRGRPITKETRRAEIQRKASAAYRERKKKNG